jgi:hypothetical protein
MNINDTLTLAWPAYTSRSDGSTPTGWISFEIYVRDSSNALFQTHSTPNATPSISFIPANRKFKAGAYSFTYRIIEEIDGQILRSEFSDPFVITFEEIAKPAKPLPMFQELQA